MIRYKTSCPERRGIYERWLYSAAFASRVNETFIIEKTLILPGICAVIVQDIELFT